MMMAN